MKRVKVLIPFMESATGTLHKAGTETNLSEETLEKLAKISPNMVLVMGEVEEPVEEPKKKARAKKDSE